MSQRDAHFTSAVKQRHPTCFACKQSLSTLPLQYTIMPRRQPHTTQRHHAAPQQPWQPTALLEEHAVRVDDIKLIRGGLGLGRLHGSLLQRVLGLDLLASELRKTEGLGRGVDVARQVVNGIVLDGARADLNAHNTGPLAKGVREDGGGKVAGHVATTIARHKAYRKLGSLVILDDNVNVVVDKDFVGVHVVDVVDGAHSHRLGGFANGAPNREAKAVVGLVLLAGTATAVMVQLG